ncbi:TM0106 family RecB-like putative nuclease [Gordonia sp. X0973]|uniref:TM0106 family RecB-like putative nuclease n=1 Tax=Gordonia sp. X0973 TaxID=2742602 RepID=UPI0026575616|nr:TM0106 family RecB-like putative nuclease [Gordonia sp. X0973]
MSTVVRSPGDSLRPPTGVLLSARDLSGCAHRLSLDNSPAARELGVDVDDSPEVARRKEAAVLHRARVRELLRSIHSDQTSSVFVAVDEGPRDRRIEQTLAAAARGVGWIWNATLPDDLVGRRRGHAELLVHDGSGYIPVIVVNHRVTKPLGASAGEGEAPRTIVTSPLWAWLPMPDPTRSLRPNRRDQQRLQHLTELLVAAGLSGERGPGQWRAGVIGMDADCIAVIDLGSMRADFAELTAQRLAVVDQRVSTEPSRIAECRDCPWWPRCEADLVRRDDVSLVVNGMVADALRDNGIATIARLAAADPDDPPPLWRVGSFPDSVAAARCHRTGVEMVRRSEKTPVARADVEVDVDMESYGEDGAYLWGTLLTDRTDPSRPVVYRPFVTWRPLPTTAEAESFAAFWAWLSAERAEAEAAGKTFAAYCYSEHAENRWLRGSADRFAGLPGVPSRAEVEAFIASPQWVDVYAAVSANFYCPSGKGLKRVAPVAGFHWRDEEAGGAASMDWYALAVGLDGSTPDETQRTRLLQYNEDDVWATKILREWMDGEDVKRLPTMRELLA